MKRSASKSPQLLRDLQAAVVDLKTVNPWLGLYRFVILGWVTISLAWLAWHAERLSLFVIGAIATSIFYSFWLICSHDAIHRTLTGWDWFDSLMPRLISWLMLIPTGTYAQLHRLHHGRNGINLQDPERVQWTDVEYEQAPAYQRLYVRYQWPIDIFLLGSIGIIVKIIRQGFKLKDSAAHLPTQIFVDIAGSLSIQAVIIVCLCLSQVSLWKYLLFLLIVERGVGIIMQTRDHLEHYGLWHRANGFQLTQLYACRNQETFGWVNWLMGGLPYHAVHHAFPEVPSYHLPEAFTRIQSVLQRYGLPPMVLDSGYLRSGLRLGLSSALIDTTTSKETALSRL